MHPRSPKLLENIRDAAQFICETTAGQGLADYSAIRLLRHAVERNFEIIGEAVKRLAGLDPDTPAQLGACAQSIAFRNVLIHGYDLVDHALVWNAVEQQAPALLSRIAAVSGSPSAG